MNFDIFSGNIELTGIFTEVVRWVFVVLAVYILVRAIKSLLQTKNPAEVWAYMNLKTFKVDESGVPIDVEEVGVPITHWENVIGRSKSCDISVGDPAFHATTAY